MATAPIATLVTEVRQRFPEVGTIGINNCRHIDSDESRPWSQHAWGNAADIPVPNSATGWKIYAWLLANKSRLSLSTICFKYLGGCNAADHQTHIHVSGSPKLGGTPPCASGGSTPSD